MELYGLEEALARLMTEMISSSLMGSQSKLFFGSEGVGSQFGFVKVRGEEL